jgi:hypothetical protein
MIISHKHNFIFIKTVKTAGTSIEVFLSGICSENADDIVTPIFPAVDGHCAKNYTGFYNPIYDCIYKKDPNVLKYALNLRKRNKFYNHMGAWLVKHRISRKIWNSYFKFCVERNPWDKALSHYSMLKHRGQFDESFDEYLEQVPPCLNYPKYTSPFDSKNILVDSVIRYERLDEELDRTFARLGIPFDGSLTVKAKGNYRSEKKSYQEVYTDKQRRLVEELYRMEIELHNYKF